MPPPYSAEKFPQMSFEAMSYPFAPAKIPMPPARLVPAFAMMRFLAMRTFGLSLLVPGAGRSGVPMRMVP